MMSTFAILMLLPYLILVLFFYRGIVAQLSRQKS